VFAQQSARTSGDTGSARGKEPFDMDQSLERPLDQAATEPSGFVPFTAFPALERGLERHLGPRSKLQLPERHQENFVRFLPWAALLMLPLHFGGVILLLGVTAIAKLFGSGSIMFALLSTAVFALDAFALPGLFAGKRRGWTLFTYALALGVVRNIVSLSGFGMLISAGLLWLAFQVKYRYR
jgi:hypothetical protein